MVTNQNKSSAGPWGEIPGTRQATPQTFSATLHTKQKRPRRAAQTPSADSRSRDRATQREDKHMNEIFKGLYEDKLDDCMISVNLIVFNGTSYHYKAKVLSEGDFIYVKTENGARLMYNKSELTMAM